MATDQKADRPGDPPPPEQIVAFSKIHVERMESSDSDDAWIIGGMPNVMLRTIGRRTGREHKVALPAWFDPEGVRVIVASFAGADHHPSWFVNLADRDANPEVLVRTQHGSFWSVPDILDTEARRDRLWTLLLEDWHWYGEYQAKTTRTIPLVRLPESRTA